VNPLLVLVGGFLGAGKTSLIACAAKILQARELRVAAIMNDQDTGLVDTLKMEAESINTREVAGGCFCCRFSDLLEAAGELEAYQPDVIFAEPVGSCIDLSATIIQPLKAFHRHSYRLAPLTVLFDPGLAQQIYNGEVDHDMEYLFKNQLAEADILCMTKSDLQTPPASFPLPVDFYLSSKTQEGVESWLDEVMTGGRIAGSQLLQVDYARYAEAEAALGWLNLHAHISLHVAASPAMLAGPLLEDLERRLTSERLTVAHAKIFNRTTSGYVKASICRNGADPQADGDLLADPELEHELAINIRVIADPDLLVGIVSDALNDIKGDVVVKRQNCFRPSPPKPQHRFNAVV